MYTLERQEFELTIQRMAMETEIALKALTHEERAKVESNMPTMAKKHNQIMFEIYSMARN